MAELIHARELSWNHLHLLEDPVLTRHDVLDAVNAYVSKIRRTGRGIHNLDAWIRSKPSSPETLVASIQESLANGRTFYVHNQNDRPVRPLLTKAPVSSSSQWIVNSSVSAELEGVLKNLLRNIQPPKPVVLRQAPGQQSSNITQDKQKTVIERHQILLDVEMENDAPMPDKAYVTLIAINKSSGTVPVQQINDVVDARDSRVFRLKQGENIEIFAIRDDMKEVKKDLRLNKNLDRSVSNGLIAPLEIVDNYKNPEDIKVHVAKYVIPEVRMLVVDYEFGLENRMPRNTAFILVNNDHGWIQTLNTSADNQLGSVWEIEEGWLRLEFEDVPKDGKFSLYSKEWGTNASAATLISEKTEEEIYKDKDFEELLADNADEAPASTERQQDKAQEWDAFLQSMKTH